MLICKHIFIVFSLISLNTYAQQRNNQTSRNASAINNYVGEQMRVTKAGDINDYKYFDNVVEGDFSPAASTPADEYVDEEPHKKRKTDMGKYSEIKNLLAQLLEKIREVEQEKRMDARELHKINVTTVPEVSSRSSANVVPSTKSSQLKLKKDESSSAGIPPSEGRQRWGHWTDWSSCSVSCGKGREIRWRHCLQNCREAETEMEEKICQLPACSPGKLFGFKL